MDAIKNATQGYALFGDALGIHPISDIDAKIITHIITIASKLTRDEQLKDLLKLYKVLSDEEYEKTLSEFLKSFSIDLNKKPMINIGDKFIGNLELIFSITTAEKWNDKLNRISYLIIVNKSENAKVPYANTEIEIDTQAEFETVLKNLKRQLENYKNVIFV